MLNRIDRSHESGPSAEVDFRKFTGPIDLDLLISATRRQARVLAVAAFLSVLLGLGYIVTAVPQYTATTDLLIDSQKDKNDVAASIAELTFDTGAIDSQVEVLKSEKIALSVISTLKLTSDAEFMAESSSLVGQGLEIVRSAFDVNRWFATSDQLQAGREFKLQRAAIAQLEGNLFVRRVARTYVLAIDYTSPDRAKAAIIANAFAEAYLTEQLDAKYDATKRASDWMQTRITGLKNDSLAADSAVQKFKADNGLVTADGKLVSDQQMTELNTQMVLAHSETAKAEARYNQITEMLKSGQTGGAVTDSLGNPVITDLRQKFLAASKTESELESKLGPTHFQVVSLRRNMAEYQRLIFEELKRIAETYQSDGEVARAKEVSLTNSMAALVGQNTGTNHAMVQLRELEQEADTYRILYQAFLQRYQESIQQQSFPVTEARVITQASQPSAPSYPKRSLIMAIFLFLGSAAGVGIGALKEYRDRVFRVAAQIREELGLEFLGILPSVDHPVVYKKPSEDRRELRQIAPKDTLQRYSIDHPLSSFSETLRSIKVAADVALDNRKPKIIGVISVLPNEGKSTVSKNLASLLAHLGAKTLLIDADLRNPGLTRALAAHANVGILEAIGGDRPLHELLLSEPDSGLFFLPAVTRKRVQHTSEVLSSPGMRGMLTHAGGVFDYIIVDLPPLAPVVDVRAAASMFDAFVFVIEWGRTPRKMVQTMLASDDLVRRKCVGAVFNKVQLGKLNLYENYGSKDFYHGRYSKYYRTDKELA